MLPPITQLALQHALLGAIGAQAGMDPLLRSFSTACIDRLSLAAVHIYLSPPAAMSDSHNGSEDRPHPPPAHHLTLPKAYNAPPHHFDAFAAILKPPGDAPLTHPRVLNENHRHWHVFPLHTMGVVVFERFHSALPPDVMTVLQTVTEHLSQSIRLITAQTQALAQARLTATAFHSHQAILITDADAVIQCVNPAFTRVTGYAGLTH